MRRLMRANFARLNRSKSFWFGIAVMLLTAVYTSWSEYRDKQLGYEVGPDSVFFTPFLINGILLAIFCSLFIGTEYSDGTIRNKLVVGHSRSSIVMSNFAVSAVAGLLMNAAYLLTACALALPLLGSFQADASTVSAYMVIGMLQTVALAAIFTALSMLIQNKSLATIVNIVGIFATFIFVSYLYSEMQAPAFLPPSLLIVNDAVQETGERLPNPAYLDDAQRAIVHFVLDVLPSGQALQILRASPPYTSRMLICAILMIVLVNMAGLLLFRRKDLK